MNNRLFLSLLIAILSIVFTACGAKDPDSGAQVPEQNMTIQCYYADEMMEKLESKEQTIRFTSEEDKYESAAKCLTDSEDDQLFPLWQGVTFNEVEFNAGALELDISLSDESRLGSAGEMFALDALKETMFQFEEVKSLDILVDGESVESLMGHVTLEHPITRD